MHTAVKKCFCIRISWSKGTIFNDIDSSWHSWQTISFSLLQGSELNFIQEGRPGIAHFRRRDGNYQVLRWEYREKKMKGTEKQKSTKEVAGQFDWLWNAVSELLKKPKWKVGVIRKNKWDSAWSILSSFLPPGAILPWQCFASPANSVEDNEVIPMKGSVQGSCLRDVRV